MPTTAEISKKAREQSERVRAWLRPFMENGKAQQVEPIQSRRASGDALARRLPLPLSGNAGAACVKVFDRAAPNDGRALQQHGMRRGPPAR